MSEMTIGLWILGLLVVGGGFFCVLAKGGARCDGSWEADADNWRADGDADAVLQAEKVDDRALSDAELQTLSAGDNPFWLPRESRQ